MFFGQLFSPIETARWLPQIEGNFRPTPLHHRSGLVLFRTFRSSIGDIISTCWASNEQSKIVTAGKNKLALSKKTEKLNTKFSRRRQNSKFSREQETTHWKISNMIFIFSMDNLKRMPLKIVFFFNFLDTEYTIVKDRTNRKGLPFLLRGFWSELLG